MVCLCWVWQCDYEQMWISSDAYQRLVSLWFCTRQRRGHTAIRLLLVVVLLLAPAAEDQARQSDTDNQDVDETGVNDRADQDDNAESPSGDATSTSDSVEAPIGQSPLDPFSEGAGQPTSSALYVQAESLGLAPSAVADAAERTLALDRLRYTAIASTVVEALGIKGESVRQGEFEVASGLGVSRVLVGQGLDPELADLILEAVVEDRGVPDGISGDEFGQSLDAFFDSILTEGLHYRLIDRVYWQRLPDGPDDYVWLGFPIDAFIAQSGVDPTVLFDGGTYVALLSGPQFSVTGQVAEIGSGWTRWQVEVGGDLAGPLSAGSGTVQHLFDAGYAGAPDLQLPATVEIDAEGLVRHIRVDVSDWWLRGYEDIGIPIDELAVVLSVGLSPLAEFETELPCDEPTVDDSEGVELPVCEPTS